MNRRETENKLGVFLMGTEETCGFEYSPSYISLVFLGFLIPVQTLAVSVRCVGCIPGMSVGLWLCISVYRKSMRWNSIEKRKT